MEFVILYAGIIAVAIFVVRAYVATFDSTQQMAPPPLPVPLDPIDVALLRSGPGDVVRAVAIGMAERGVIEIRSDGLARIAAASVSRTEPIENAIYDALGTKLTFPQLSRAVYPTVTEALAAYEARLREASLLRPSADLARARFAKLAAAAVVLILGILELTHLRGTHPTALGVVAGFALGIGGIVMLLRSGRIARTTDRGRRYLARIAAGFPAASLRAHVGDPAATPMAANGLFAAAPLLVGLYGLAELRDTPYAGAAIGLRSAVDRKRADGGCGSCGGCGWTPLGGCGTTSSGSGSHGGCGGHHGGGCGHGGCSSGCGGGGCGGCGG